MNQTLLQVKIEKITKKSVQKYISRCFINVASSIQLRRKHDHEEEKRKDTVLA